MVLKTYLRPRREEEEKLMSNNQNQVLSSSLDFTSLRKLMDELIKLKRINDLYSLDADYSFDWQEDANQMIDDINKFVNKTLENLDCKDYTNGLCNLTFLKISLQSLNGTIDGITNDIILLNNDDECFTWPVIPEGYIPPQ